MIVKTDAIKGSTRKIKNYIGPVLKLHNCIKDKKNCNSTFILSWIIEKLGRTTLISKRIAATEEEKKKLQIQKVAIKTFCESFHEASKSSIDSRLPYGFMLEFI